MRAEHASFYATALICSYHNSTQTLGGSVVILIPLCKIDIGNSGWGLLLSHSLKSSCGCLIYKRRGREKRVQLTIDTLSMVSQYTMHTAHQPQVNNYNMPTHKQLFIKCELLTTQIIWEPIVLRYLEQASVKAGLLFDVRNLVTSWNRWNHPKVILRKWLHLWFEKWRQCAGFIRKPTYQLDNTA